MQNLYCTCSNGENILKQSVPRVKYHPHKVLHEDGPFVCCRPHGQTPRVTGEIEPQLIASASHWLSHKAERLQVLRNRGAWEQEVKANALCQFVLFINSLSVCRNYRSNMQERVKGEILWNCEAAAELGCLYDWTNILSGCHTSLTTPGLCNSVNLLGFIGCRGLCRFPTLCLSNNEL